MAPVAALAEIRTALAAGSLIPYLGPGMLELMPDCPVPNTPEELAVLMSSRVAVPHKIRERLTATAQFIENFKHRKTLVSQMHQAFCAGAQPSALHRTLAAHPALALIVDCWYDDAMQNALAARADWGLVQGLSQSEHVGHWSGWYDAQARPSSESAAQDWQTLLYQPLGSVAPADNFIVSDSDYVEVLTEIDIQTPIPQRVQTLREGCSFLFLGCRFTDQLQRSFARQIMKRSSGRHWAVLPDEPTRNEHRFLAEQQIERIDWQLEAFEGWLTA
jgi:hypothetical protein